MVGPNSEEVTGRGRKVHNEEHQSMYSLQGVIRVIKTGRMR